MYLKKLKRENFQQPDEQQKQDLKAELDQKLAKFIKPENQPIKYK